MKERHDENVLSNREHRQREIEVTKKELNEILNVRSIMSNMKNENSLEGINGSFELAEERLNELEDR